MKLIDFALGYIQRILSGLTTNLALGQMKLSVPALDFVAKELEAVPDISNNVGPVKSFLSALLRSLRRVVFVVLS
jgi:hypothetical protein